LNIEIPEAFSNIEINEEYEKALQCIYKENKNLIILGNSGSGKSRFIELMQAIDEQNNSNSIYIAPTGVSAVNINGATIHSTFKLGIDLKDPEDVYLHTEVKDLILTISRIVIDEISMVRSDILDTIDILCKRAKDVDNVPFGGIQVVCIGDLYQLPPIIGSSKEEKEFYNSLYGDNPYFFSSNVFKLNKSSFSLVEFSKIYRQKDEQYKTILNKIRINEQDDSDLQEINNRRMSYRKFKREFNNGVYIAPYNKIVDEINKEELDKISFSEIKFVARISGKINPKNFLIPIELVVKRGAKIMMLLNSPDKEYQNGTMAVFEKQINKDCVQININGKYKIIQRFKFSEYKYKMVNGKLIKEEIGSFSQYPFKLAFAISSHKSQGSTFSEGYVDFGYKIFAEHQVYVMLSRFTDLNTIGLKRNLNHEDIFISDKVKDFIENYKEGETE
jgi:ATP-dependent DNA helicase PIF1